MIASLRMRLVISVVCLSAAGLAVLGAVTYADQRSFLLGQLDQQLRASVPAVSQALDGSGLTPARLAAPPAPGSRTAAPGAPPGPRRGPPSLQLPPGTYGQRREPSGRVVGHVLISYGQAAPPTPRIPRRPPLNAVFSVASAGGSGLRYEVYATADPVVPGITVVAVPLREVDATLSRLLLVEGLVMLGVLAALTASALVLVRAGLRPLDRMAYTAGRIAAGELSHRVGAADRRSEVGRLGHALNAMLDRLEQAFAQRAASEERLRRFLADASHELRTPLASIRGYAELFRLGAERDRAATELAMRRIEEESGRMGTLVEELLTLARLDAAPVTRRQPVDIVTLTGDAVQDARASAPGRAITLTAPARAPLLGDRHQLGQVLANLLRNALVHTPEGTPVDVEVALDECDVRVTVRDHGPGLPPGDPARLFERFWRAEGGRERGRSGAGLGLAIVSSIVSAHGGSVTAGPAEGGGAIFALRLPRGGPAAVAGAGGGRATPGA